MKKIKSIILLSKKEGETPLECLESFRLKHKGYQDVPLTYAGRLDPMASGLLLILAGEECKYKDKYLALNKEYEFEVLFGFATDTFDILGKVKKNSKVKIKESEINRNLKFFRGKFPQVYPIFSSRTVKGKPLFEYARSGEFVELPEREVEVMSLKYHKLRKISAKKLLFNIEKRIKKVSGDFRQREIVKLWQKYLKNGEDSFFVAKFKIKCSSGTYVRSIAHAMGQKMGVPALAYSIRRTKIGKWQKGE